jgi:hypothetical protein
MQPLEPEKMLVDVLVAGWLHTKPVSYHIQPVPFHPPTSAHEVLRMKTCVQRGHPNRHFSVATARRTAKVHAEGKKIALPR